MSKEWIDVTSKMAEDAQQTLNKISEANTKVLESLFANQSSVISGTMETWQKSFEKLAETKDLSEAAKLQSETARSCGEIVMEGFKENIAALSAARDEFTQLFEENAKSAADFMEKLAKSATDSATKRTRKTS